MKSELQKAVKVLDEARRKFFTARLQLKQDEADMYLRLRGDGQKRTEKEIDATIRKALADAYEAVAEAETSYAVARDAFEALLALTKK